MSSNLFYYEYKRIAAFKVNISNNNITLIHKCNDLEINIQFNPQSNWKLNDNEIKCFNHKDKMQKKYVLIVLKVFILCDKTDGANNNRIDLFELQF